MTSKIFNAIESLIKENNVVLFMKGTKSAPMCGFSGLVVQVLKKFNIDFQEVNILEDPEMRQGIKDFSQWPTLPQLYIKGEFIGGADIVKEMYQSGEFETLLSEKNLLKTAV
jgi:monothiol glutaredoxin